MDIVSFVGIGASICTATAAIPQLVKVIRAKKTDGISLTMLLVLTIGLGLWFFYGYLKNDFILLIANSVPFIVNTLIVIFYFKYKK